MTHSRKDGRFDRGATGSDAGGGGADRGDFERDAADQRGYGADAFDRDALRFRPLSERRNRVTAAEVYEASRRGPEHVPKEVTEVAETIRAARDRGAAVMLSFGAHTIKNGMGPCISRIADVGWITHLATNGAGVIHDWELAFQGATSEDVRENVLRGEFGLWSETGFYINAAIVVGAYRGWGYGESVGRLVADDGLDIPDESELSSVIGDGDLETVAAAADLLSQIRSGRIEPGPLRLPHRYSDIGLQNGALKAGVAYTAHPMFGHDIIYAHPLCTGAGIGRTAERDFLRFVESVSRLEGGVYLSVGSAVMSPMVFEKSLSMARNRSFGRGEGIENFSIYAVDLASMQWDWERDGEPPHDNPAYYVRFCKSFSRMGGKFTYISADASDFFPALAKALS